MHVVFQWSRKQLCIGYWGEGLLYSRLSIIWSGYWGGGGVTTPLSSISELSRAQTVKFTAYIYTVLILT